MGILSIASAASLYRGYGYFVDKRVIKSEQIGESQFKGIVAGSNGNKYDVIIDIEHPRKGSSCTCPHANGRQIICKHMIALYFTEFPNEAEEYREYMEAERRDAEMEREIVASQIDILEQTIDGMSKSELKDALADILMQGPTCQLQDFLWTYGDPDDMEDLEDMIDEYGRDYDDYDEEDEDDFDDYDFFLENMGRDIEQLASFGIEVIMDIRRVAEKMNTDEMSWDEYRQNGGLYKAEVFDDKQIGSFSQLCELAGVKFKSTIVPFIGKKSED